MLPVASVQQAHFLSFPQRLFSLVSSLEGGYRELIYLGKYVQPGQVYWKWQSVRFLSPLLKEENRAGLCSLSQRSFLLKQRPHHVTIDFAVELELAFNKAL